MDRPIEKILSLKISYSPWVFFVLFLTADLLLVFARAPLAVNLSILLFGILAPFVLGLFLLKNPVSVSDKNTFFQTEWFDISPWLWIFLAALFVATRFYKLTSLPWPTSDDGYIAYCANRLATQGDWRILYGSTRSEPLFIWGLAAWFKLFRSSLLALKTFPLLLYVGVLAAGYFGTRRYFSKTISFITLWFLAFNFWAFYNNRQCQAMELLILFECLAFCFLGLFLLTDTPRQTKYLWLLAFCIGIGFYTFTAWPGVAAMASLPVILGTQYDRSRSVKKLIGFILITLLLALPLIHARLLPGGTTYLQALLLGHSAGLNLDYIEALFWNGLGLSPEDPSQFGWLNPCFGALFLVGFLELWRFRFSKLTQWCLLAFLLFLVPGLLTDHVDMYRVIPLLPLASLFAALGFNALLSKTKFSSRKNLIVFLLLAIFSLGLDIYHYVGPGQFQDWNYYVSNKRHFTAVDLSRAYPLLESTHRNGVPLLMLLDLNNNNQNQTLNVVSAPFDMAGHSVILNQTNSRAALLINCNYEPFLKKEFPDSEWTWLSPELSNDYGGLMLGFVPINAANHEILKRWAKADEVFKQNNAMYMDYISGQDIDLILKDLYDHYPIFHGDRFLESIFWEKVAFYDEFQNKIPEAVAALRNGAHDGYAAAQFYNQLGDLFAFFGNKKEAKSCFEKALSCPVNRTTAAVKLKHLETI